MPKINMFSCEKSNRELKAKITSYLILNGISREIAAKKAGLSLASWHRRLKSPQKFTVEELRRLGLTVTIE